MAATKLAVLLTLLYILKVQVVMAQGMSGPCCGSCTGFGYCGGYYPTVYDTSDKNDPLDIILPVLLLAMCNKVAGGVKTSAPFTSCNECGCGPGCGSGCSSGGCSSCCSSGCGNGCSGGCGGGCGGGCSNICCNGCNSGCGNGCGGGCSTGLSSGCCGCC